MTPVSSSPALTHTQLCLLVLIITITIIRTESIFPSKLVTLQVKTRLTQLALPNLGIGLHQVFSQHAAKSISPEYL